MNMNNDHFDETMQPMNEWIHSVEMTWDKAKERLKDFVDETKLNRWEKDLGEIHTNLSKIQHARMDEGSDHFVTGLEQIKQQCDILYEQYQEFTNTMASTSLLQDTDGEKSDAEKKEPLRNSTKKEMSFKGNVPPGKHKLPPLPYAYNALEPYISKEIMKLHHDIHHQGYVDGLNKAETKMLEARQSGNFDLIRHWEREAAFNGAGHYLHTIFWNVMSPEGGGKPKGDLWKQIEHDFDHYDAFKKHFTEAAKEVEGPGWAILIWSPRSHRLEILQAEKHQNLSQWDVVPLLVLDVWEHAYYLQYKTDKDNYVDRWWNVVNWDHVTKRYNKAKKLKWKPF